jgi:2-keto-3-deoxy-L-rhamnonate aldolase RhmA
VNRLSLRARLAAGETVLGTLSLLPEPSLPEIAGWAGFDFYVADTEHVAVEGQHLAHIVRAARSAGIDPLVRVRHVEEKELLWTLDMGVEGFMIPLLEDAATARTAYELSRYPPDGRRTLCSASRATRHGTRRGYDFPDYLRSANDDTVIVGLVETLTGIENLNAILREGVDVICVGRGDLSIKLGFPYEPLHPEVTKLTRRIVETTIEAGKAASVVAYTIADAREWIERGCRFVIYSQPEMILADHYRKALESLRPHVAAR